MKAKNAGVANDSYVELGTWVCKESASRTVDKSDREVCTRITLARRGPTVVTLNFNTLANCLALRFARGNFMCLALHRKNLNGAVK